MSLEPCACCTAVGWCVNVTNGSILLVLCMRCYKASHDTHGLPCKAQSDG